MKFFKKNLNYIRLEKKQKMNVIQMNMFNRIYHTINPRNEREFDDIIDRMVKKYQKYVPLYNLDKTWKTYALWAFGYDAIGCCVCEDIPEHYIKCHICDKIICNGCFDDNRLCGDAFYKVTTTDKIGELVAYYCKKCK